MNEELKESKNDNQSKINNIIDEANEQFVIKNIAKNLDKILSFISNEFYFINKEVYECSSCKKIIKYNAGLFQYATLPPLPPDV